MSKSDDPETSPINTSYLTVFHIAILFVAPFMTAVFPPELRNDALMVSVIFPITLFWFSYLIKQFIDVTITTHLIIGGMFVVAALSFLNAVYGDISAESVPIIYTQVPFFATLSAGLSGPPGLIYAGTILTYGAYVYIFCVAVASMFETIYEGYVKQVLPKGLLKKLGRIDSKIDKSATRVSDQFFVFNQIIGLLICFAFLFIYALLYIYLLVK